MKRILPVLAILLVAGCARSEDASLVPPDGKEGYNRVGKVGTPEEDDREPAIGQWRSSLQENVQALEFGPMGTEPLFSLLCSGDRTVLLQRHGGAPTGPIPMLQIAKGDFSERLQATVGGSTIPMLRVQVPLDSPVAEAAAAGGEPLMIRLGDGAPLVLPPSPLIGDYLRSCEGAPALPASQSGIGANMRLPTNSTAPAPGGNSAAPDPAADSAAPAPAAAGNSAQPK